MSPPFLFNDFPSSPSSAWSFGTSSLSPSSATQDHPSPPTPDSCFPLAPTIVSPDEFALQIDLRLDKPSVSPPPAGTYYLPGEDISKDRVLLSAQESMYDRFESSPPLLPRVPRVPPENTTDYFSWEATQPTLANENELSDPLRYSLLIHEVSLLVGLTAEDDHLLPVDGGSLVLNGSERVPDILPLSLSPTKSLASRKQRSISPPYPTSSPSNNPISSSINPHADLSAAGMLIEKQPLVRSTEFSAPIPRHNPPYAIHPSLSPYRRQGQVFHVEPPLPDPPHRRTIGLDKSFTHPRELPPKPMPNPLSNRCSSLDRLERSLLKLEAYAPDNHHKSQCKGRSSNHVLQRKDRCPSLPPPRRLKKQHSNQEHMRRSPSHHHYPSGSPQPASRPDPFHQHDEPCGEYDTTPGSFMDMDIPQTEASQKPQAYFPSKKIKNIFGVARRLSRGVIAWGKNLAGPTKPSLEETTTVQNRAYL